MESFLHCQCLLIEQIQAFIGQIDDRFVSGAKEKEFFHHAANELTHPNPTQQMSSNTLANKIINQLAPRPGLAQILDQLDYRIKIMKENDAHELDEITLKFQKDQQKMKECGAKVRDFQQMYEQQLKDLSQSPNELAKKAIGYFESTNKDWALDEMLCHLIGQLSPRHYEEHQQGEFDEQSKAQLDCLIQQLQDVGTTFQF